MSDIGKLTVALYANSAQFVSELNKSQRKAKSWASSVGGAASLAAKTTGVAAVAAAGSLMLVYKRQAEIIDQTAKFADRIGMSTEALTQLRYASELTGVGSKNLDMAMQRMTRRIEEAAQGSGTAAPALKQLGLDAEQLGKMTPDQQLKVLADSFKDVESQSERVALAFKLFDSGGVGMVNMLANGSEGLNQMAAEADNLGITLSRVDAAKVEMANDAMFKVSQTTTALHQEITTQLAPVIAGLADEFLGFAQSYGGLDKLISDSIANMVTGVGYLADSFRGIQLVMASLEVGWQGFKVGFMTVSQFIVDGLNELGNFIFEVIVSPLQTVLTLAGNFSDEAAEMSRSLAELSNSKPPQLFDASDVNQATLDLNQSLWELRKLAGEPLPSEGIESWYQQTKSKFDQLATDYANSVNYNNSSGNTDDAGTGKVAKQDPAVAAFQQATAEIETEWQRRLAIQAAGDQASAVQEEFAYQDRYAKMTEQFELAYAAAQGNQILQKELESQFWASRETLAAEHQANLTEIEKEGAQARYAAKATELSNYSSLLESMAGIAAGFAGEQTGIFRAMFVASKAFAVAESIVKIQQGIANAAALPFPANIPAMASVAAATSGIISTIQSTNLTGMAHSGISEVPSEGTWLLDKGERVYTNDSAAKLDQMHGAIMGGQSANGSGKVTVNLIEDSSRAGQVEQSQGVSGEEVITIVVSNIRQGGEIASAQEQTYNLQRAGY